MVRDKRSGADRRQAERRQMADRRLAFVRRARPRTAPCPYTSAEITRLRQAFSTPGSQVACPACGGAFSLGRGRRRGTEVLRRVECSGCGRSAVVANNSMARILVISQKSQVRDALRGVLSEAQHDVVEAADAAVGLWAYRLEPADVVLVDVLATGRVDAAEFVRKLRKEFPDARVVAMSGRTSYGVADPLAVAKQLGASRTIRIPLSRQELLQVVEEVRE